MVEVRKRELTSFHECRRMKNAVPVLSLVAGWQYARML